MKRLGRSRALSNGAANSGALRCHNDVHVVDGAVGDSCGAEAGRDMRELEFAQERCQQAFCEADCIRLVTHLGLILKLLTGVNHGPDVAVARVDFEDQAATSVD